jgi:hypothetical protein
MQIYSTVSAAGPPNVHSSTPGTTAEPGPKVKLTLEHAFDILDHRNKHDSSIFQ